MRPNQATFTLVIITFLWADTLREFVGALIHGYLLTSSKLSQPYIDRIDLTIRISCSWGLSPLFAMSAGESDALHHIHCSGGPERTTAGRGGLLQNSVALRFCGPAAALSGVGCGMILLFPKRAMDRERERYYCINHHQDYHISGSLKGGSLKASVAFRKWHLALPIFPLMGM